MEVRLLLLYETPFPGHDVYTHESMELGVWQHKEAAVVMGERIVTHMKLWRQMQMLFFTEFSAFTIPNKLENALTIGDKEESSVWSHRPPSRVEVQFD